MISALEHLSFTMKTKKRQKFPESIIEAGKESSKKPKKLSSFAQTATEKFMMIFDQAKLLPSKQAETGRS